MAASLKGIDPTLKMYLKVHKLPDVYEVSRLQLELQELVLLLNSLYTDYSNRLIVVVVSCTSSPDHSHLLQHSGYTCTLQEG